QLFINFATTTLVVLQIPYLEEQIGASKTAAGFSVFVFTGISVLGRLVFGFMADRIPKHLMLAASATLVVIGMPIIALADSYAMAIVGICIVAPGFGGMIPVRPALLADYFGTKYF